MGSKNVTDLEYFVQRDNSKDIYQKLQENEKMLEKTLDKCQMVQTERHQAIELIAELKWDEISDKKWNYRKPQDMVNIHGRMSKDLSLFYTVDDVRKLFNWKRPMYHNICKLVSQ